MSDQKSKVTVIIPTLAEASRKESLLRAIKSVQEQQGAIVNLIIVVNGSQYDDGLREHLRSLRDLRLFYHEPAHPHQARRFGVIQTDTKFYAFLDDDDVFLPRGLQKRIVALGRAEEAALVVSNGYRQRGSSRDLVLKSTQTYSNEPLMGLLSENWLASCAGLYRRDLVTEKYFDEDLKYFEWTLTALKLALYEQIVFIDEPTFIIYDSENSLSKSFDYMQASLDFIEKALKLPLPSTARRGFQVKAGEALHSLSEHFREAGELNQAWRYHLRCLKCRRGLRYLSYTRHLLFKS